MTVHEHCGLHREEASLTYVARWMTGSSQASANDDFGDPRKLGKGLRVCVCVCVCVCVWLPSATAEKDDVVYWYLIQLSTAVPVGPPRPSSITRPEADPATVTCSYIVGWHRWTRVCVHVVRMWVCL